MTKGSRRCAAYDCHRQATGALLHIRGRNDKRAYGTHACQEHLEEATQRELRNDLYLPQLLLLAARGEIRQRSYYWPVGG